MLFSNTLTTELVWQCCLSGACTFAVTVGKAEGALVARHMENASPGVEAANGVGSVASVAEQHTGLLLTGVLHGLLG